MLKPFSWQLAHALSVRRLAIPTSANFVCTNVSILLTFVHAIEFTKQAAQALKAMSRNTAATIRARIDALAVDPYVPNPNAKKLTGREGYRLRVGDWRVL